MSESDRDCPRCRGPLQPSASERWRCPSCGGSWLDRAAVLALLDLADAGKLALVSPASYRTAAHVPRQADSAAQSEGAVRYLPCPRCAAWMLRTRFLRDEPAVGDVCVLHGVWFDANELESTVASLSKKGSGCRSELRPLIAEHFGPPSPPPGQRRG